MVKQTLYAALFAALLCVGVLVCLRLGWWLGRKRLARLHVTDHAGLGAVEGAIFGLLGLLIAFTFTSAAARFDSRRELITQQLNAIGTAWLRLDLLDEPLRSEMRGHFRDYLDTLLAVTEDAEDAGAVDAALVRLRGIETSIWAIAADAARTSPSPPLGPVLLPPINEMFDMTTSRVMASRQHPPTAIYVMLGALVLVSALMAGFGMSRGKAQSLVHVFGFAAVLALSVYLILDLGYPRLGMIRIDKFDKGLIELRRSME